MDVRDTLNKVKGLFGGNTAADTADGVTCPDCHSVYTKKQLAKTHMVCPDCGHHYRLSARARIELLTDKKSFKEYFYDVQSIDPLHFPHYAEKLSDARQRTGENEAVVCGTATVGGYPCALFAMDPRFIMASMGSAVGEKLTRLFELATDEGLPVIGFAASGGARMQEGILSLMQMAKVSGAVARHSDGGGLYIPILTDPTTGGVTASFAMQGDIILAEPKALIGFAGRRVIEQTIGRQLPADFQSAEFLLAHGFIDKIVPRGEQRDTLTVLLRQHATDWKGALAHDGI